MRESSLNALIFIHKCIIDMLKWFMKKLKTKFLQKRTPPKNSTYIAMQGRTARFKSGPFLYRKYERGIKESNVCSSCY